MSQNFPTNKRKIALKKEEKAKILNEVHARDERKESVLH